MRSNALKEDQKRAWGWTNTDDCAWQELTKGRFGTLVIMPDQVFSPTMNRRGLLPTPVPQSSHSSEGEATAGASSSMAPIMTSVVHLEHGSQKTAMDGLTHSMGDVYLRSTTAVTPRSPSAVSSVCSGSALQRDIAATTGLEQYQFRKKSRRSTSPMSTRSDASSMSTISDWSTSTAPRTTVSEPIVRPKH